MKNAEKFKTTLDRAKAFDCYCNSACRNERGECNPARCALEWLELEAKHEKPDGCPFCGGTTEIVGDGTYQVACMKCMYASAMSTDVDRCVADHNRISRSARGASK